MKIDVDGNISVSFPDNEYSEKGLTRQLLVKVWFFEEEVGNFVLAPLPGCCGVVVSTQSYLIPKWRKRISKAFHKAKEMTARKFGYSLMLATTQLVNLPEVIGAAKNGWRFVETFRNSRTSHDLGMMVKKL